MSTLLGVGAWPGPQLRFDEVGRAAPAGHNWRKLGAVPPTDVTLSATPVADCGMLHSPF